MATAQDIVTEAFKAINAIDINEASASPAEMSGGLGRLNRLIASWAGQGLAVADQSMTGDLASGGAKVTVASTANLAPGLNVSGASLSPPPSTIHPDALATGARGRRAEGWGVGQPKAPKPSPAFFKLVRRR
jgi:hypothetical protein